MGWPKGKPREVESVEKGRKTAAARKKREPEPVRFSIDDNGALTVAQGSRLWWPFTPRDTERLHDFLDRTRGRRCPPLEPVSAPAPALPPIIERAA